MSEKTRTTRATHREKLVRKQGGSTLGVIELTTRKTDSDESEPFNYERTLLVEMAIAIALIAEKVGVKMPETTAFPTLHRIAKKRNPAKRQKPKIPVVIE